MNDDLGNEYKFTDLEIAAFDGLNKSYIWMEERLIKLAPKCHFTPMSLERGDGGDCVNQWCECHHCGHTKSI